MSEILDGREVAPAAELVVYGIKEWLQREVGSSVVGRNQYLDDFNDFRSSLFLDYGDYRNVNAAKSRSHHDRLADWTAGFVEYYDELDDTASEYTLARQIFCGQMFLSGLFRVQCMMQAASQEDYYHRRIDGNGTGIDLEIVVAERLSGLFGGEVPDAESFSKPHIQLYELAQQTKEANNRQLANTQYLHEAGRHHMSQESSPVIDKLIDLQTRWANLIVNYIGFAAGERDGQLGFVPFLEAKSISDDPQVYHPFAEAA